MEPKIDNIPEKKLVGIRLTMSISQNRMKELWSSFMPRRTEIVNCVTQDFISLAIYHPNYFKEFKPTNEYERWAAIEVTDFDHIPKGMESFITPKGLYAVFEYKGLSTDNTVFQYIFGTWLPNSGYQLDDRPHFELLGKKYRNDNPNSEEEIWIPIKHKQTDQLNQNT